MSRDVEILGSLSPIEWCHTVLNGKHGGDPHFSDSPAPMHLEWSDIYASKQNAAIAAPRGFGKSTHFCFGFPLWELCTQGIRKVVIISDALDLAKDHIISLERELEDNELIHSVYGNMVGSKWTEIEFTTSTRGTFKAYGSGKRMRGSKTGAYRPQLIICDDIENDKNVLSATQRSQMSTWFWGAVAPMLPRRGGRLIFCGTILHEDSQLSRMLLEKRWVTRRYQALVNNKSTWEAGCTTEWLLEEKQAYKERGELAVFEQEYNNRPASEETREFKSDWHHNCSFIDTPDGRMIKVPGEDLLSLSLCKTFIAVDPQAVKDAHDKTGVVIVHVDEGNRIFVEKGFYLNLSPPEIIEYLYELYDTYDPAVLGVEYEAGMRMLESFITKHAMQTGQHIPIKSLQTLGREKTLRIRSLLPYYKSGYIYHNVDHCTELEAQLSMFPRSKLDDVIDAMAYILDIMYPGSAKKETMTYDEYEVKELMRGRKPLQRGSNALRRRYGRRITG